MAERAAETRLFPRRDRLVLLHSTAPPHHRSLLSDWLPRLAPRRPGLRQHFRRITYLLTVHVLLV